MLLVNVKQIEDGWIVWTDRFKVWWEKIEFRLKAPSLKHQNDWYRIGMAYYLNSKMEFFTNNTVSKKLMKSKFEENWFFFFFALAFPYS